MRPTFVLCLLTTTVLTAQGPTHISPAAAATGNGSSNNMIPFSWTPVSYQQVHDAASFSNPGPGVFTNLSFRMAQGFVNRPGQTIDVEIHMAWCPTTAATASLLYANNITPGTEINVFTRKMVLLPTLPNTNWSVSFPFDAPFSFPGNLNLSWRAIVWGNSNGNVRFDYALDAFDNRGHTSANGATQGCQAQNGGFPATHSAYMSGVGGTSTFNGYSYVAAGGLPAILVLGTSGVNWAGVPLPIDLTPFGAPGCLISNSLAMTVTGATQPGRGGDVAINLPIPNDPSLSGAVFFSQFWFVDLLANALGLFTTNSLQVTVGVSPDVTRIWGATTAISGSADRQYGLAIGLN